MTTTVAQSEISSHEILLAFENWCLAEAGATASASWTARGIGEPFIDPTPDKLTSPDLDTAWRSGSIVELLATEPTAAGKISVSFDLGTRRSMDWVSIHRSNIRVPWRVDFYRADPALGGAPVFSSPWTNPIIRASLSDYGYRDLVFSLGPTRRQLDRWASLFRLDSFIAADRLYWGVRYVVMVFDVSGGSNGGADYLQFAYPVVGRAFRPDINMVLGWSMTPVDRSETRRMESGAKRGRKKSKGATLSFALGYLERYEAYSRILTDWLKEHGVLDLVFAWPEPAQRRHFYDQAILGQLGESLPTVAMANLEVPDARGFSIEEAE